MKRYIIFLIFALASFITLLLLGLFNNYTAGLLQEVFWLGDRTMTMLFWIPYMFIAVSGMFLGGAVFIRGCNKRENVVLGFLNLILAIAFALFTVLPIGLAIRNILPVISLRTWDDGGAAPSLVFAGILFANELRLFAGAGKKTDI